MGYYVLQEGGREDQLARQLKVILVKLPREEKRRRKKEERLRVVKGGPLGSIVERKRQGKRREKERDGLGGGPRPRPGQVSELTLRRRRLDRNRNEIILSKNSIQCRFFRSYLSISDADNPFSGPRPTLLVRSSRPSLLPFCCDLNRGNKKNYVPPTADTCSVACPCSCIQPT